MSTEHPVSRRRFTATASAGLVLPVLAACGSGDSGGSGTASDSSSSPSDSGAGGGTGAGAGTVLASASDVEVGGAVFLEEPSVVITQPEKGEFKAFSRTCTHQQCPVTDIVDGQIHCSCHGSLFDMTTGDNVGGPAPSPLTEVPITVEGGDITVA
jgi:Rieske Fe-S protein